MHTGSKLMQNVRYIQARAKRNSKKLTGNVTRTLCIRLVSTRTLKFERTNFSTIRVQVYCQPAYNIKNT